MTRRILFGGIWHETNGFSPVPTDLEAFRRFQYVEGDELLTAYQGTNTEMGGIVEAAPGLGFELVPTVFAGAVPSGMVARAALEHIVGRIVDGARRAGQLDGALIVLHGAMVADGVDEADAYVLRRVREAMGEARPIVATFDLHANLSPPMVEAADVLVGYDTLPHVDMAERGREAAAILRRLLDGAPRPAKAFRKLPLLTAPQKQATHESPMREVMAIREEVERDPDVWTASVVSGFPYCDLPHLGVAVLAYGTPDAADRLAEALWSRRERFRPELLSPEEAVRRAMAAPRGPVCLVEPADNVAGGSPGDGTHLLRALFAARAPSAAVVLWDPEVAAGAYARGTGAEIQAMVGGHSGPLQGEPVAVDGTISHAGRLVYRRDASYMRGQKVDLGPVAVIDSRGIRVVVTTERAMPLDTMHLRSAGVRPEEQGIITVKCGSAWSGAFGELAAGHIYVDTPGVCTSNLERLPYTRLAGKVWPLAEDASWSPPGRG